MASREVVRAVVVPAHPRAVFEAWVDPERLTRWFCDRAVVAPRKGGVYALEWGRWGGPEHYVTAGVFERYEPGHRFWLFNVYDYPPDGDVYGPMAWGVELESVGGNGTRVTVRQGGFGEGPWWDRYYDGCAEGWERSLSRLEAYLAEWQGVV